MTDASPNHRDPGSNGSSDTERDTEVAARTFAAIVKNVGQAVHGKDEVTELVVLAMIAGGHVLIEDVPGVGKTTLAKAVASSIDGTFGRIQFNPDLMPSDVVGVSIYDERSSAFEFQPGPVFANIVLADEINRATAKAQSALLESMAEGQVTVSGVTYGLEAPFLVLATQNPAEHEGAYALPDSQYDRFLLRVSMGYPSEAAEIAVLESDGADRALPRLRPVATTAQIAQMSQASRTVHVAPGLRHYLVDLATASRRHPRLSLGISPRATLSLQRAAQARALVSGRPFVTPDDIKALAVPTLAHRIQLAPNLAGVARSQVVAELLAQVPVPTSAGARN